MATDIDICQKALLKINQENVLPVDSLTNPVGKAARACAAFYADARRQVFRLASWTCITKRLALCKEVWEDGWPYALGDQIVGGLGVWKCTTPGTSGGTEPDWTDTSPITDGNAVWTFQYATERALKADNYTGKAYQYAMPADYLRKITFTDQYGASQPFDHEGGVVFSDVDSLVLVYVYDSTVPDEWDALLEAAVVLMLASAIAYPVSGSHEDEAAFAQGARSLAREAELNTLREKRRGPQPSDPWISGLFPDRK